MEIFLICGGIAALFLYLCKKHFENNENKIIEVLKLKQHEKCYGVKDHAFIIYDEKKEKYYKISSLIFFDSSRYGNDNAAQLLEELRKEEK